MAGYRGSGCTRLAEYLAFEFADEIQSAVKHDSQSKIEYLYERLETQTKSPFHNPEEIAKIKNELKIELEKREIINVVKRNKLELKKPFFYISFSSVIVYFIIRYLGQKQKSNSEQSLREIVEKQLASQALTIEHAQDLIKYFETITKKMRYSRSTNEDKSQQKIIFEKEKIERISFLFNQFHSIRDAIVATFGPQKLQDIGDSIRKTGRPFVSTHPRKKPDYIKARYLAWIVDKFITYFGSVANDYKFFVIECFKNPQELYYFREKYAYFYLFAVDTERQIREERTKVSNYTDVEKREKGEQNDINETYKLNVPRCMDLADVVIKNNRDFSGLFWKMLRYFVLILETGCIKPNHVETLMQHAYTLAVRSNCISKQVGAVITNKDGYIIGAGWNDVGEGQISCGLKTARDYREIKYLQDNKIDLSGMQDSHYICFKDCFKDDEGGSKGLIYCLALHAEENAILQLARYNSDMPQGGEIYTTAFPCPLCLKKISQVGIAKIIYTESYANPIVSKILEKTTKEIQTESFEGVKYYSYFRLFKPYYDRKEQQKLLI